MSTRGSPSALWEDADWHDRIKDLVKALNGATVGWLTACADAGSGARVAAELGIRDDRIAKLVGDPVFLRAWPGRSEDRLPFVELVDVTSQRVRPGWSPAISAVELERLRCDVLLEGVHTAIFALLAQSGPVGDVCRLLLGRRPGEGRAGVLEAFQEGPVASVPKFRLSDAFSLRLQGQPSLSQRYALIAKLLA